MKVVLTTDRAVKHYYECLAACLTHAGIEPVWTNKSDRDSEVGAIWDGPKYVGHFSIYDHGVPHWIADPVRAWDGKILLSIAPDMGAYAEGIEDRIVQAGYFSPLLVQHPVPYVPWSERTHLIQARMRTHQHAEDRKSRPWSLARKRICEDADKAGFPSQKIAPEAFASELADSKIGLNWRGICRLNFRVVEYLAYGVCMFTDPLDFDILPGVRIREREEAVFIHDPADMVAGAIFLEDDQPHELERVAENGRRFYQNHLSPEALGAFYRRTIEEVL